MFAVEEVGLTNETVTEDHNEAFHTNDYQQFDATQADTEEISEENVPSESIHSHSSNENVIEAEPRPVSSGQEIGEENEQDGKEEAEFSQEIQSGASIKGSPEREESSQEVSRTSPPTSSSALPEPGESVGATSRGSNGSNTIQDEVSARRGDGSAKSLSSYEGSLKVKSEEVIRDQEDIPISGVESGKIHSDSTVNSKHSSKSGQAVKQRSSSLPFHVGSPPTLASPSQTMESGQQESGTLKVEQEVGITPKTSIGSVKSEPRSPRGQASPPKSPRTSTGVLPQSVPSGHSTASSREYQLPVTPHPSPTSPCESSGVMQDTVPEISVSSTKTHEGLGQQNMDTSGEHVKEASYTSPACTSDVSDKEDEKKGMTPSHFSDKEKNRLSPMKAKGKGMSSFLGQVAKKVSNLLSPSPSKESVADETPDIKSTITDASVSPRNMVEGDMKRHDLGSKDSLQLPPSSTGSKVSARTSDESVGHKIKMSHSSKGSSRSSVDSRHQKQHHLQERHSSRKSLEERSRKLVKHSQSSLKSQHSACSSRDSIRSAKISSEQHDAYKSTSRSKHSSGSSRHSQSSVSTAVSTDSGSHTSEKSSSSDHDKILDKYLGDYGSRTMVATRLTKEERNAFEEKDVDQSASKSSVQSSEIEAHYLETEMYKHGTTKAPELMHQDRKSVSKGGGSKSSSKASVTSSNASVRISGQDRHGSRHSLAGTPKHSRSSLRSQHSSKDSVRAHSALGEYLTVPSPISLRSQHTSGSSGHSQHSGRKESSRHSEQPMSGSSQGSLKNLSAQQSLCSSRSGSGQESPVSPRSKSHQKSVVSPRRGSGQQSPGSTKSGYDQQSLGSPRSGSSRHSATRDLSQRIDQECSFEYESEDSLKERDINKRDSSSSTLNGEIAEKIIQEETMVQKSSKTMETPEYIHHERRNVIKSTGSGTKYDVSMEGASAARSDSRSIEQQLLHRQASGEGSFAALRNETGPVRAIPRQESRETHGISVRTIDDNTGVAEIGIGQLAAELGRAIRTSTESSRETSQHALIRVDQDQSSQSTSPSRSSESLASIESEKGDVEGSLPQESVKVSVEDEPSTADSGSLSFMEQEFRKISAKYLPNNDSSQVIAEEQKAAAVIPAKKELDVDKERVSRISVADQTALLGHMKEDNKLYTTLRAGGSPISKETNGQQIVSLDLSDKTSSSLDLDFSKEKEPDTAVSGYSPSLESLQDGAFMIVRHKRSKEKTEDSSAASELEKLQLAGSKLSDAEDRRDGRHLSPDKIFGTRMVEIVHTSEEDMGTRKAPRRKRRRSEERKPSIGSQSSARETESDGSRSSIVIPSEGESYGEESKPDQITVQQVHDRLSKVSFCDNIITYSFSSAGATTSSKLTEGADTWQIVEELLDQSSQETIPENKLRRVSLPIFRTSKIASSVASPRSLILMPADSEDYISIDELLASSHAKKDTSKLTQTVDSKDLIGRFTSGENIYLASGAEDKSKDTMKTTEETKANVKDKAYSPSDKTEPFIAVQTRHKSNIDQSQVKLVYGKNGQLIGYVDMKAYKSDTHRPILHLIDPLNRAKDGKIDLPDQEPRMPSRQNIMSMSQPVFGSKKSDKTAAILMQRLFSKDSEEDQPKDSSENFPTASDLFRETMEREGAEDREGGSSSTEEISKINEYTVDSETEVQRAELQSSTSDQTYTSSSMSIDASRFDSTPSVSAPVYPVTSDTMDAETYSALLESQRTPTHATPLSQAANQYTYIDQSSASSSTSQLSAHAVQVYQKPGGVTYTVKKLTGTDDTGEKGAVETGLSNEDLWGTEYRVTPVEPENPPPDVVKHPVRTSASVLLEKFFVNQPEGNLKEVEEFIPEPSFSKDVVVQRSSVSTTGPVLSEKDIGEQDKAEKDKVLVQKSEVLTVFTKKEVLPKIYASMPGFSHNGKGWNVYEGTKETGGSRSQSPPSVNSSLSELFVMYDMAEKRLGIGNHDSGLNVEDMYKMAEEKLGYEGTSASREKTDVSSKSVDELLDVQEKPAPIMERRQTDMQDYRSLMPDRLPSVHSYTELDPNRKTSSSRGSYQQLLSVRSETSSGYLKLERSRESSTTQLRQSSSLKVTGGSDISLRSVESGDLARSHSTPDRQVGNLRDFISL